MTDPYRAPDADQEAATAQGEVERGRMWLLVVGAAVIGTRALGLALGRSAGALLQLALASWLLNWSYQGRDSARGWLALLCGLAIPATLVLHTRDLSRAFSDWVMMAVLLVDAMAAIILVLFPSIQTFQRHQRERG
jgi:hypothetical protein